MSSSGLASAGPGQVGPLVPLGGRRARPLTVDEARVAAELAARAGGGGRVRVDVAELTDRLGLERSRVLAAAGALVRAKVLEDVGLGAGGDLVVWMAGAARRAQAVRAPTLADPERAARAQAAARRMVLGGDRWLRERAAAVAGRVAVGIDGVVVRWAPMAEETMGLYLRPFDAEPAEVRLSAALPAGRCQFDLEGRTVATADEAGFARLVDDLLAHELAHHVAWTARSDGPAGDAEDPGQGVEDDHGWPFLVAAEILWANGDDRFPRPAARTLAGWPMACRPEGHYGEAAPGLGPAWAADLIANGGRPPRRQGP